MNTYWQLGANLGLDNQSILGVDQDLLELVAMDTTSQHMGEDF